MLHLAAGASVSLRTYFCAFPAARWTETTGLTELRITGRASGSGRLRVCTRSRDGSRTSEFALACGGFDHELSLRADDLWVWIEVDAGAEPISLTDMEWEAEPADHGQAAICITTFNRPDDCVAVLQRLAGDEALLGVVSDVFVVDQGTRRVTDVPGFGAAATSLEDRLTVTEQANLGGSGGFSRGMLEAERAGATYAIVLDDDVRVEPESILRLIALASRAPSPTIVGAQMLDLDRPTRLHSWGERVARPQFDWVSASPVLDGADLTTVDVTDHDPRAAVDFNGWWMCLIPCHVIRLLGAAMPFFIKWDDTEYALRAAAAGYRTVNLAGAAVWHVAWTAKDDGLDWQAYFQLRNRVVTALLHGGASPWGLLRVTFAQDVNHVVCMQYGAAAARLQALEDVLSGPDHLDAVLGSRADDMRALMRRSGQVPIPEHAVGPVSGGGIARQPTSAGAALVRTLRVLLHQSRRPSPDASRVLDARLPRPSGKWWSLGLLDSAAVESAAGSGVFISRRDRRRAVVLVRDAVGVRWRLLRAWPRLRAEYSSAGPRQSSAMAWAARFEGDDVVSDDR